MNYSEYRGCFMFVCSMAISCEDCQQYPEIHSRCNSCSNCANWKECNPDDIGGVRQSRRREREKNNWDIR